MRQSSNRPPGNSSESTIATLGEAEELIFRPTELQRKLKIRFWAKMDSNPLIDRESVTLEQAKRLCGTNSLDSGGLTRHSRTGF